MLYLSGVILAGFLSFVLFSKRGKTHADYVLAVWLGVTGYLLFSYYLVFTAQHTAWPLTLMVGMSLPLTQGAFLFIYTWLQTTGRPFRLSLLLHFLPFLGSLLLYLPFFLLSREEQIAIIQAAGKGYELQALIRLLAIYASGIVYVVLCLRLLVRYRRSILHQFSNTDKISFNWLLYLTLWNGLIWFVILVIQQDEFIFGSAVLFVAWIGYYGIRQVQVFSQHCPPLSLPGDGEVRAVLPDSSPDPAETAPVKYRNSALTASAASGIHTRLLDLLRTEKPFLNPDLTLNDLAERLVVHPNHLSQVINSLEQKTFYDLINEMRVQEFLRLVSEKGTGTYTLLGLALDCGFSSKASFNRNFKKYTGKTPTEHLGSGESE